MLFIIFCGVWLFFPETMLIKYWDQVLVALSSLPLLLSSLLVENSSLFSSLRLIYPILLRSNRWTLSIDAWICMITVIILLIHRETLLSNMLFCIISEIHKDIQETGTGQLVGPVPHAKWWQLEHTCWDICSHIHFCMYGEKDLEEGVYGQHGMWR